MEDGVDVPKQEQKSTSGVYIKLADDLKPEDVRKEKTWRQSQLFELWTKRNDVAMNKMFRLGSDGEVSAGEDKGLFSTILAAYNNHWVLKTRPEDWWTTISQIIATRIDKKANDTAVRKFFVSHEGKKKLTVRIGPSVHGINSERFFSEMISQITRNINKPEYTSLMESDFSGSTAVDRVINSIMLMYSFKEYFEYRAFLYCGIPGVSMLGSEEDWRRLVDKLEKVEVLLQPIEDVLQLGDWFSSCKGVLKKLLETYQGNPDTDWWSRIINIFMTFGSGGGSKRQLKSGKIKSNPGTTFSGWFITAFLGVRSGDLKDIPSGVNVVPLTITDGLREEQSALVAGVTGYTVTEWEVTEPLTDTRYPSVQPAHGWGLLMKEDSVFH